MRVIPVVLVGCVLTGCAAGAPPPKRAEPPTPSSRASVEAAPEVADRASVGRTPAGEADDVARDEAEGMSGRDDTVPLAVPLERCPFGTSRISVWVEETRDGAALVVTADDDVDALRENVRALAAGYDRSTASRMRAHVDRVHGGMRLVLEPTSPAGRSDVVVQTQSLAHALVDRCPMVLVARPVEESDEPAEAETEAPEVGVEEVAPTKETDEPGTESDEDGEEAEGVAPTADESEGAGGDDNEGGQGGADEGDGGGGGAPGGEPEEPDEPDDPDDPALPGDDDDDDEPELPGDEEPEPPGGDEPRLGG